MISGKYIITNDNWLHLLKIFSERVNDKIYAKLPYQEWRIYSSAVGDIQVFLSYAANMMKFTVRQKGGYDYIHNIDLLHGSPTPGFDEFFLTHWEAYAYTADYFCEKTNEDVKMKEEKNTMKFNFEFGPIENDAVRMSIYGLAVKNNSGSWVAYDKNSKQIMDVDVFNFDGSKFIYKMPVALKEVKEGDVIIHNRKAVIVEKINKDGFWVVDPREGEKKNVLPTKSMFGFDFLTKIISFVDFSNSNVNADNPFGNPNTLMMLAMMDGNTDMASMLPFMAMSQGQQMNPMMMLLLMKDNDNMKDMLPLMFMMQNSNPFAAPVVSE